MATFKRCSSMGASSSSNRGVRFGDFEIDITNRELRKRGRVVRLQPKQFTLLLILAEHAGQIVSREEIRDNIWDPNTFVDFERSINFAINQVRVALGDSAEKPRFIETIPRLGYRFLCPVEVLQNPSESPRSSLTSPGSTTPDGEAAVAAEARPPGEAGAGSFGRASFDAVARGMVEPPVKQANARLGLSKRRIFSAIAVSTLLILIAAVLGWRLITGHAIRPPKSGSLASGKADPQTRTVPLTYFAGQMGNPAFSPDGKEIAFVWDGSDHKQLNVYTLPVGGDQPYQVTHFGSKMSDLSWSPDGQSLAYSRCADRIGGIYAVPALGGPEHKLTGIQCAAANGEAPQYTPDGRFLLFHDAACGTVDPYTLALVVMSLDTGKKRCITTPPISNWDMYFRLAPDGTKVAFVRAAHPGVGDYYVVSILGGTPLRLVSGEVLPSGIMWSPDSRRIIFRSGHNGVLGDHLSQVPPAGGEIEPELIYTKLGAMSPDGRRVAYVEERGGESESIWQIKLSGPGGSVISHRKIIESIGDGSPQLSQDGSRIVFASIRSGSSEVWTSDAEGKNPVKLTSFGGEIVGTPRWSPDGKWIVFDRRPTSPQLHLMNADGGDPHLLIRTHVGDVNDVGSWSRDGKAVFFNSSRGGDFQLWKQSLTADKLPDGEAIQITHKGGFTGFESYDGKTIYYTQDNELAPKETAGIWSIPIAGGPEVRVTPAPQCWGDWGISESGLYMLDRAAAPKPTIEFYNFKTRRITPVTQITGTSLCLSPGMSASRDGRTVLYTQFVPPTNYIFMNELLK
jgi:Tol biopolymer transport system component/DNA-binding winged helix-turn-helix (wHTH) protein